MPSLGVGHLSDIHLAGYAAGALFDEDADVRRELEYDLERVAEEAGGLGMLLLGGDIAGRGQPHEFNSAAEWVDRLSALLGISEERVYCVPGNHDVRWEIINADPVFQLVRNFLLDCPVEQLNLELTRFLGSGPHRGVLLTALEPYNQFAARYGCDLQPDMHRWEQAITLGPLTVKLVGLSSALLSGPNDARTADESRLVLGPQVSNLGRFADTFMVLLCHHPLPWMRDGARVEHLVDRAHLQLFGHEHMFDICETGAGVRVHAGALHPSRGGYEPWEPSYNVIRLTVADDAVSPVQVDIWPRRLQADGIFGPLDPGNAVQSFELVVERPGVVMPPEAVPTFKGPPAEPPPAPTAVDERRAARRFSALSTERRLLMGRTLELLTPADNELDEGARGRLVFRRAREHGRLRDLEEEMDGDD